MQLASAKIVFVMPRCRHDHVRGVHKQAWSLAQAGFEIVLVVKDGGVAEYLGMAVVSARSPFNGFLRPLLNLPAQLRQACQLKGDLYVLRNPDTIPMAFALRALGRKVIYDTQEDFSRRPLIRESLPVWIRPGIAWLITRLEQLLARITRTVIVTQPQQRIGLGGRTVFQPNAPLIGGPIVELSAQQLRPKSKRQLKFVYVGEISRSRGLFAMLDLILSVSEKHNAHLDLVGLVHSDKLLEQARQHLGWRFTSFHGERSHATALRFIRESDVGLALLQPVADYPTASITKLYEYMQFGVPFIASAFAAWRVNTKFGAPGFYVNPDCASDITIAGLELARNVALRERMGRAGRHYVESEFHWEIVSKPFVELMRELVPDGAIERAI
jgi:glycosyltransferase involved in cell wall biosynthesis